jgi:hypothetical protein
MEVKPKHKHCPRTDYKHRSRDDYKGKNKYEQRPRKSGGHKKERAMVAGASDIDSGSYHASSSSSDEDENRHKSKWSSKNITTCASPPKAFAVWHIAPQARRATRITQALTLMKRWEAWRAFG